MNSTGPTITAVGLAATLLSEALKQPIGVWIFKPLASLGFLYTGYHSPAYTSGSQFGKTMFASLVLGFLGDVCLIHKSPAAFQAGLFSFLLGHLGFAYAFAERGMELKPALTAAAAVGLVGSVVWKWLSPNLPKADRIPVALYTTVISAMVVAASGSAWNTPTPYLQIAGAIIFQLSDLCVARQQFVHKTFLNPLVGLPLYYLSQQMIASLMYY